jgi:hypothetical protein
VATDQSSSRRAFGICRSITGCSNPAFPDGDNYNGAGSQTPVNWEERFGGYDVRRFKG